MADDKHARSSKTVNVLGLAGSLRRDSINRRLLAEAARHAAPGVALRVHDGVATVPLFNEDLEIGPFKAPESVVRLRQDIERADGLIIATPEYNHSMPGVLKNLIDWLSRGERDVLSDKPVAIFGATQGQWGTRLAQAALRQTLTACGALIMPAPQLFLRKGEDLFDADGRLSDQHAIDGLAHFCAAFRDWIYLTKANR